MGKAIKRISISCAVGILAIMLAIAIWWYKVTTYQIYSWQVDNSNGEWKIAPSIVDKVNELGNFRFSYIPEYQKLLMQKAEKAGIGEAGLTEALKAAEKAADQTGLKIKVPVYIKTAVKDSTEVMTILYEYDYGTQANLFGSIPLSSSEEKGFFAVVIQRNSGKVILAESTL